MLPRSAAEEDFRGKRYFLIRADAKHGIVLLVNMNKVRSEALNGLPVACRHNSNVRRVGQVKVVSGLRWSCGNVKQFEIVTLKSARVDREQLDGGAVAEVLRVRGEREKGELRLRAHRKVGARRRVGQRRVARREESVVARVLHHKEGNGHTQK